MKEEQETQDCRATEFDYLLADPHMQMLKAALPYMPSSRQRFCSMLIQIQQIQRTQSVSGRATEHDGACALGKQDLLPD